MRQGRLAGAYGQKSVISRCLNFIYSVVNGEPATKKLLRGAILFGQYFRKDGLGSGLWTFLTTTHSLNFTWYTDVPGKYAIFITCFMK